MKLRSVVVVATLAVSWPSTMAVAAQQYVVDAAAGSDSKSGAQGSPWKTVQKAADTVQAGDTVTIKPGTYAEAVSLKKSGAPNNPITFIFQPGAVLDGSGLEKVGFEVTAVMHVVIKGLAAKNFSNNPGVLVRPGASAITIEKCEVTKNKVGIRVGDSPRDLAGSGAKGVHITGCHLWENTRAGLLLTGATHDVQIEDTASFLNDDGKFCAGESDGFAIDSYAVDNVTFTRTQAYNNGEDGYDLKGATMTLDQVQSFQNGCNGFKVHLGTQTKATVRLTNALIHHNGATGFETNVSDKAFQKNGHSVSLYHCTVVNNEKGVEFGAKVSKEGYKATLRDSIIVGPGKVLEVAPSVVLDEDYNLLWRDPKGPLITWKGGGSGKGAFTTEDVNTNGKWAQKGGGANTKSSNPLLDLITYAPGKGSRAIDNAERRTPPVVAVDVYGTSRGAMPDIGAVESSAAGEPYIPFVDPGKCDLKAQPECRVVLVGRPAIFDASGSRADDGGRLSYEWDFGDGTPKDQAAKTLHTFDSEKTYTCKLTVKKASGGPPASASFTVRAQICNTALALALSSHSVVVVGGNAPAPLNISYKNLAGNGVLTVIVPPELVVDGASDGATVEGQEITWNNLTRPSGRLSVSIREVNGELTGNLRKGEELRVVTTATLRENPGQNNERRVDREFKTRIKGPSK